jgi:hypothetical protein
VLVSGVDGADANLDPVEEVVDETGVDSFDSMTPPYERR